MKKKGKQDAKDGPSRLKFTAEQINAIHKQVFRSQTEDDLNSDIQKDRIQSSHPQYNYYLEKLQSQTDHIGMSNIQSLKLIKQLNYCQDQPSEVHYVRVKQTVTQRKYNNTYQILKIGQASFPGSNSNMTLIEVPPSLSNSKPLLVLDNIFGKTFILSTSKIQENLFQVVLSEVKLNLMVQQESIQLNFSPKNIVRLNMNTIMNCQSKSLFVIFSKQSINQAYTFEIHLQPNHQIKIGNKKKGMPGNLFKLISQKSQVNLKSRLGSSLDTRVNTRDEVFCQIIQIESIKEVENEQNTILIALVHDSYLNQYSLYSIKIKEQNNKTCFYQTDVFQMKKGKMLNSFFIGDQKRLSSSLSVLNLTVIYDCSKLQQVQINLSILDDNTKPYVMPASERVIQKFNHQLNFSEIKQFVQIEGTPDIIVGDTYKSLSEEARAEQVQISIFEPGIKIKKQNSPKVKYLGGNFQESNQKYPSLLLFELQKNLDSLSLLLPSPEQIFLLHYSSESKFTLLNFVRISLDETIDYYLNIQNNIPMALKLINDYKLFDSTKILEYQLKNCNYRDINLLEKFMAIKCRNMGTDSENYNAVFKQLTHILLKQRVDGFHSLNSLLEQNLRVIIKKIGLNQVIDSDQNQQDQDYARQLISYKKRLNLYQSIQELQEEFKIFWPTEFITLSDEKLMLLSSSPQNFMLQQDFTFEICENLFFNYKKQNEQQNEVMDRQSFEKINDQIVLKLVEHCQHEVALNFQDFLNILPFQKLSSATIFDLLPPLKRHKDDTSSLWSRLFSAQIQDSEAYFIENQASLESKYTEILSGMLAEFDQAEKVFEICTRVIEVQGADLQSIYELTLESVMRIGSILPDTQFNLFKKFIIPNTNVYCISFCSPLLPHNIDQTLQNIDKYFEKIKFVFLRDLIAYEAYLKQLRYYVSFFLDPNHRQDFLEAMLRSQAEKQLMFTLRDCDLIQILLDLIYNPVYKPISLIPEQVDSELLINEKDIKYLRYSKETVEFIYEHIIPMIKINESEEQVQLELSINQKIFISEHLLKHLKIGQLEVIQNIVFDNLQNSNTIKNIPNEEHKNLKTLDLEDLKFVHFLKLTSKKDNQNIELVESFLQKLIDTQIKLSQRKREKFKNLTSHLTKQTHSLFNLVTSGIGNIFLAPNDEQRDSINQATTSDAVWYRLYSQLEQLVLLLGFSEHIQLAKLFIKKMLSIGNIDGVQQLIIHKRQNEAILDEANLCVLEQVQAEFNGLSFDLKAEATSPKVTDLNAMKEQKKQQFFNFSSKSKNFLKMMIQNKNEENVFLKLCKKEIQLIEVTEQLMEKNLLVWSIPLAQIREDFGKNQIFMRILQVYGIKETFLDGQSKLKALDNFIFSLQIEDIFNFNKSVFVLFEILIRLEQNQWFQLQNAPKSNENTIVLDFVKEQISKLLFNLKDFQIENLQQSKYRYSVQNILLRILQQEIHQQNDQDQKSIFLNQLVNFLLNSSDKKSLGSQELNQLCFLFNQQQATSQKNYQSANSVDEFDNQQLLQQSLEQNQQYRVLFIIDQLFNQKSKDNQDKLLFFADSNCQFTYLQCQNLIKILELEEIYARKIKQLKKMKYSESQNWLQLIIKDLEEIDQPVEVQAQSILDFKVEDGFDFEKKIIEIKSDIYLQAQGDASSLKSISVMCNYLDKQESVSRDGLVFALYCFNQPSQTIEAYFRLMESLCSSIIDLHSDLVGISFTFIFSYIFQDSQSNTCQNKLPTNSCSKSINSAVAHLKEMKNIQENSIESHIFVELYQKINVQNFYSAIQILEDIDESLRELNIYKDSMLVQICALAQYIKQMQQDKKYTTPLNTISIDDETLQDLFLQET